MVGVLLRAAISALGLWVASQLLDGLQLATPAKLALAAVLLGVVNAFVRPLVGLLALPLTCLTLGLFTLIINTFMFWLAGVVGTNFGVGFSVEGFLPAFLGGLLVSAVSMVLSFIFKDELKGKH